MGGLDASDKLRCVLPYTLTRKLGLRMVRFRFETISLGSALDDLEERVFLDSTVEHFRRRQMDIVIPSNNTALFRTYPVGAIAAPYGTLINDLTLSEEALMSGIRKTYRSNIRKALEAGVTIKCGLHYLETSYHLIADTLKRSGIKFKSFEEFKAMILGLGDQVKVYVAEHAGVVQGCMVSPFSEYGAYNWYAGSRPEPVLGSQHLLHWEAMRQFRTLGVKRFNFQGVRIDPEKASKQEGILNYKKGFGGTFVRGYMWKYSLHALKYAAYSAAMRWLMGGDIVDQEGHKLTPH
jgi:lipid II:glycine glycyltransferase (peptidoglycan interpeptide bridge formation enzyme)